MEYFLIQVLSVGVLKYMSTTFSAKLGTLVLILQLLFFHMYLCCYSEVGGVQLEKGDVTHFSGPIKI